MRVIVGPLSLMDFRLFIYLFGVIVYRSARVRNHDALKLS